MTLLLGVSVLCAPIDAVHAHSFGVIYTLPVPFWLYAWSASAALIVSFVIVGLFAAAPSRAVGTSIDIGTHAGAASSNASATADTQRWRSLPRVVVIALKTLALLSLALCIVTGLWGTPNPYGNFNMTFFWIVFVLGFAYLTAVVGDLYGRISPFRTLLVDVLRRRDDADGALRYPAAALGYAPALVLYAAFLWLELFSHGSPLTLGWSLFGYTVLTVVGGLVFGVRDWLRYGEFLGVWLRLIARLAPVQFADDGSTARFAWRAPFAALRERLPHAHWTLLVFVLFMLSSTAFDGLHEAAVWVELYWTTLYRDVLAAHFGTNPFAAFPKLLALYPWWQMGWLLASPWLYLAVYLAGIAAVRALLPGNAALPALGARVESTAAHKPSLMTLALAFAPSLLPIVLVYHASHYYTLVETQGIRIVALASDPFGRGWNLFGTAQWFQRQFVPDSAIVWHVQVGLILAGHIVSVYVAHLIALDLARGRRGAAAVSQLPMLALMVAFTVVGLWILSQPMKAGAGS